MNPDLSRFRRPAAVALGVFILLVILGSSHPVLVVPAGQRAVVFNVFSGVEGRVLGEGYRLFIPLVQYPELFDVRTQTYTISATAEDKVQVDPNPLICLTSDGQPVTLDITLLYRPVVDKLPLLYQQVGNYREYVDKIVRPELRALTRMVVAQYSVTQLYSGNREALETAIRDRLGEAFLRSYLQVEAVKLRNLTFSKEFQATIEQKQVALQQVERMKYVLDQAQKDKQKAIVTARGEADAIRLVADSISRNPQLLDYTYVQSLNPQAKTVVVQGNSLVNLGDLLTGSTTAKAEDK